MQHSDLDQGGASPVPGWPGGVWLGDGIFETIRVLGARPVALDAHLARCLESCAALGLATAREEIEGAAHVALRSHPTLPADAVLRLVVAGGTRATDGHRVWAWCAPLPDELAARRTGVHARSVPATPCLLSAHKTTSAMLHRLAQRNAAPHEPLYVDDLGSALEGATWSLFARFGDRIVTPPLDGRILPGVTRARALAAAAGLGFSVVEAPLEATALRRADEVFVTNALLPAAPLLSLDAHPLSPDRTARDALSACLT